MVEDNLRQLSGSIDRTPEKFFAFLGSAIGGLAVGEALYVIVIGRLPMPVPIMPWWFAAVLVCVAVVWMVRESNRSLRIAIGLFVASQALQYAHWIDKSIVRWSLSTAVQFGIGLLMVIAFWPTMRRRAKLIIIVVFIAAVPIRYWTIYNWHSTLDRYRHQPQISWAAPCKASCAHSRSGPSSGFLAHKRVALTA